MVGDWSTAQLAAILFLPIYPAPRAGSGTLNNGRLHDHAGHPSDLLMRWTAKLVVFSVVVTYLMSSDIILTPFTTVVLAIGLYSFVGVLMDGPGSLATYFLGFNIIPTFDHPWMSSSLADFWGRRWNITTSHVLRAVVYDPIVEGCFVRRNDGQTVATKGTSSFVKLKATFLGTCATFLVSGLVHEAIFWSVMSDGVWRWKWLLFFTMQGPLVIMEYMLIRWCRKSRSFASISPWTTRPIVLSTMIYMGQYLFMAPAVLDTDLALRVLMACRASINHAISFVGMS